MMHKIVMHNDGVRTTFTVMPEIADELRKRASGSGKSMSSIVNDLLRKAIWGEPAQARSEPYRVQSRPLGLRAGIDPERLSALLVDLDVADLDHP